jgi:hypothetical protein
MVDHSMMAADGVIEGKLTPLLNYKRHKMLVVSMLLIVGTSFV